MKHNFKLSLVKGDKGETNFLALFGACKKLDGRHGDLLTACGLKVELKTDYYDMQKSANYFIERWSDVGKQKPGGPWQAEGHGCDLFAYYFVGNRELHVWDLGRLMKHLRGIINKKCLDAVSVHNRSWVTVGFKVPRKWLMPDAVVRHNEALEIVSTAAFGVEGESVLGALFGEAGAGAADGRGEGV